MYWIAVGVGVVGWALCSLVWHRLMSAYEQIDRLSDAIGVAGQVLRDALVDGPTPQDGFEWLMIAEALIERLRARLAQAEAQVEAHADALQSANEQIERLRAMNTEHARDMGVLADALGTAVENARRPDNRPDWPRRASDLIKRLCREAEEQARIVEAANAAVAQERDAARERIAELEAQLKDALLQTLSDAASDCNAYTEGYQAGTTDSAKRPAGKPRRWRVVRSDGEWWADDHGEWCVRCATRAAARAECARRNAEQ